jgi:hypothetical protein
VLLSIVNTNNLSVMENVAQHQLANNTRPYITEEQDHWSNEFGISKDELTAAAQAGESSTAAVEKYVKSVKLTV